MSDDEENARFYGGKERVSGSEMDAQRAQQMAYEYLCHLEEARVWISKCLDEELPPSTEMEEALRNGVTLAKLGNFFAADVVPLKRIYDKDLKYYKTRGLHFRHTDNINYYTRACEKVGLPRVFYPETTDVYDRKNMPKTIYSIHALSLYLFRLGLAPQIQDLYGKATFTEEEIDNMSKELQKYGLQLPSFSKIGGILAKELPVDEAAMHAAVIVINEMIDKGVAEETLQALQNQNAHLFDVSCDSAVEYQNALAAAKNIKEEAAKAKAASLDQEQDIYDHYLTQAEIQGTVTSVNDDSKAKKKEQAVKIITEMINQAISRGDLEELIVGLQDNVMCLQSVDEKNVNYYLKELTEKRNQKLKMRIEQGKLNHTEIQEGVLNGNNTAEQYRRMRSFLKNINHSLSFGTAEETHELLQKPEALLPPVLNRSAHLYHNSLLKARKAKETELGNDVHLTYEELYAHVKVTSAVAAINEAIEKEASAELIDKLMNPDAQLTAVDESAEQKYLDHLASVKEEKGEAYGFGKDDLTQVELQLCVEYVNTEVQEERDLLAALSEINDTIEKNNPSDTLTALQMPTAKLDDVRPENAELYQLLLAAAKRDKAQRKKFDSSELWHDDIVKCVEEANDMSLEAEQLVSGVARVHHALNEGDSQKSLQALRSKELQLRGIIPDCAQNYHDNLVHARLDKTQPDYSPWLEEETSRGFLYYYNLDTGESRWSQPFEFRENAGILTRKEIRACCNDVSAEFAHQKFLHDNEPSAVKIQSNWRGYKARKAYCERQEYIRSQTPNVIKIQASVRRWLQRKKYRERKEHFEQHEPEIVKIQSYQRMYAARKQYLERKEYFKQHTDAIVKIQAFFRGNLAFSDYKALISLKDPPVKVVRTFLHLLDQSDADYEEEIELQKVKAQVVTEIRSNQQLEKDLNLMDIKIGLLVKNRITLQDVVMHNKKLKRDKKDHDDDQNAQQMTRGIKELSKESRQLLEAYQNLFYLLQTNPTYLAKLIFAMPQSKSTKFMESVVLTLYNYASNAREEYLLLKLFETALREEVESKVDELVDFITGNPTVIRMVVHFNRGTKGHSMLSDLLQPLVKGVLDDKNLCLNTNPVEVYKAWINQMESETGEASKLPYDVDTKDALKHPEVQAKVDAAISSLIPATDKFLNTFISSVDKIPYGMRHIAKSLREALVKKFPDAPQDDILKVVGNLIYYRYMNPAIVAPDAFDIVEVSVDKGLNQEQRRNLGAIAKLLQFAISNKKFDAETEYLAKLGPYIEKTFQKLRKYLMDVSTVEPPETFFNIDEYSDVTMLAKPTIYISIQEICDTHALLLEHREQITSGLADPLEEILDELGESAPRIEDLIGQVEVQEGEEIVNVILKAAKAEISLTLTNKYEVPEDDDSDMKALFVRTKRLIIDVMRVQQGNSLTDILETPATEEQEEQHMTLIKTRELVEASRDKKKEQLTRSTSLYGDNKLPLEGMKRKIIRNLRMLESQGLVTIKDDYQDMVNAIAKDIRNQRRYRIRRKQELRKLQQTLTRLQSKAKFYEEQIDYYNQYIKVCLDNLSTKGRQKSKKGKSGPEFVKGTVKYTAQGLHNKGVILEIEGLPPSQFKNVIFEITACDVGVFEVNAKFMGVAMQKVELVFQDLLQLQYEGIAVLKMFEKAKINVNLLIFFLNKKFYGK